mgnify:CR=1 FL=1
MEKEQKKELIRTLKYVIIAASAGVIQFGSTAILALIWPVEKFANGPVLFYLIGLTLSVIWNLTINRKYTFKSANNMGIAILWTLGFYIIFAPSSLLLQGWLTNGVLIEDSTLVLKNCLGWHTLVGTIINMILNLGLEYPFQRFIVFRNSIDQTEKKD